MTTLEISPNDNVQLIIDNLYDTSITELIIKNVNLDLDLALAKEVSRFLGYHEFFSHTALAPKTPPESEKMRRFLANFWGFLSGAYGYLIGLHDFKAGFKLPSAEPSEIDSIAFVNTPIGDGCAEVLGRRLDSMHIIRKKALTLTFQNCQLTDATLAHLITSNSLLPIGELDLSNNNNLTDKSCDTLSKIIQQQSHYHHPLNTLNLSGNNKFTKKLLRTLENALVNNITITHIDLRGCGFDQKELPKLQAHLDDNRAIAELKKLISPSLHKLDLTDQTMSDELIRRTCKMIRCGVRIEGIKFHKDNNNNNHKYTNNIRLGGKDVAETDDRFATAHIEQLRHVMLSNTTVTNVEQINDPTVKRLALHNRLINAIKTSFSNQMYRTVGLMLLAGFLTYFASAALDEYALGHLAEYVAANTLSILSTVAAIAAPVVAVAASIITGVVYTSFSNWFEQKLNALKKAEKWQESDIEEAKWGEACQRSVVYWANPIRSYTPAAYLAYQDKNHDALPEAVEAAVKPRVAARR